MQNEKSTEAGVTTPSTQFSANVETVSAVTRLDIAAIQDSGVNTSDDEWAIALIADSVRRIGLQTPITVDSNKNIIAGVKRFRAVKLLGLTTIDAFTLHDHSTAQLWKLSENLHRTDLPALERSDAITAWSRAQDKDGQLDQVKGGRGKLGGIANAARELGLTRSELRRACEIASITPEARSAIKNANLDNNQSVLLQIAAEPAETQSSKVRELAEKRASNRPAHPHSDDDAEKREFDAVKTAWRNARQSVRDRFVDEISIPYFSTRNL